MVVLQENADTDLSTTSLEGELGFEERQVQDFAKRMLQSRFFIGSFQEKRLVLSLEAYRDVIVVSKEETDLIQDLEIVRKRIAGISNSRWIGITTPETIGAPVGHCLWVELSEEVFGSYWYKIKTVKFREKEIFLKLKVIRSVSPKSVETREADTVDSCINTISADSRETTTGQFVEQWSLCSKLNYIKMLLLLGCSYFYKNIGTLNNIKEAIVFISLLIVTTIAGCGKLLQYLAEYFLKLIRELNGLIRAFTPIVIACIDAITKMVGGFYILIAMVWNGSAKRQLYPQQNNAPMLTYDCKIFSSDNTYRRNYGSSYLNERRRKP